MIIANYQVQSTLRAYGQQQAEKNRLPRVNSQKSLPVKDQVVLSAESKKRMTAEKIAAQIFNQFGSIYEPNDTTREILDRLSREYGQPLEVEGREGRGLAFKVLDASGDAGGRYLPAEEAEDLKKKLLEITRSVVYNHLS